MNNLTGTTISNRYFIGEELSAGGMGTIFLAKDILSDRSVVVKALHSLRKNDKNKKRFIREAEILKQLNHPNIVAIQEFLEWKGELYIILEYLKGESLQEKIKERGIFELDDITTFFTQIMDALEAAHKSSVIHRDLKPTNIICVPGKGSMKQFKVLDFGISISLFDDPENRLTKTGEIVGTPYYLSPEQISGKQDVSFHTDIYSLGIILYELLTGTPPFTGPNDIDILLGHLYRVPRKIVREDLEGDPLYEKYLNIIKRSLVKNTDDRFGSISELREFFKSAPDPEKKVTKNILTDRISRQKESFKGPVKVPENEVTKSITDRFSPVDTEKVKVGVMENENSPVERSLIPLLEVSNFSIIKITGEVDPDDILSTDIIILNEDNKSNLENLKKITGHNNLAGKPVLICGEETDLEFISNAINSGAADYIPHPFSPEEVIEKLKKHLQ